jgi:arylsulfatase A-like enzyme
VSLASLAACRPEAPRPPHIVLVMVDTLRAKNLGAYGYGRPTSPSLDRLAGDGALFENAIAVGGNTTTSMAGVFTGHYPFFEFGEPWSEASYYGLERFRRRPGLGIPRAMTTVAEHLSSAGYQTAAFITNPYLKSTFSMHQGFDRYEEMLGSTGFSPASAEQVLEHARRHLAGVDWQRPTFLYLHFMDVHGPYRAPNPAVVGDLPETYGRVRHHELWQAWESLANADVATHGFEREYMLASYDSGIRHVDDAVGRLLQDYEDRGLLEKTLFMVTADHGEEFLEHRGTGHKGTLFDEIVHVPLIVRAPGGSRGVRRRELVRNFDVAATLLDYAGITAATAAMDARSFRPLLEGRPFDGTKTAYAGFPGIRMIRTDRHKLLRRQDGSEIFYDLSQDPAEAAGQPPSQDAAAQVARLALGEAMDETARGLEGDGASKREPSEAITLDETTRAQLKALGYQ